MGHFKTMVPLSRWKLWEWDKYFIHCMVTFDKLYCSFLKLDRCCCTLAPSSHSYPNHSLWHNGIVGFRSSLRHRQVSLFCFSSSFAKWEMAQNVVHWPALTSDIWRFSSEYQSGIMGYGTIAEAKIWWRSLCREAAYEGGDWPEGNAQFMSNMTAEHSGGGGGGDILSETSTHWRSALISCITESYPLRLFP